MDDKNLAIVIPAYKREFLGQSLASIAAQTNKNFTLYIGDDNSPHQLYEIVKEYEPLINIIYLKFDQNIGSHDLIQQWARCIELIGDEEWIWLFSDDDIMDSTCVENFFLQQKIADSQYDVYRFNTKTINDEGKVIRTNPTFSNPESSIGFLKKKLNREIDSYVTEYIFSVKIYKNTSGFVNFPLAWASDDATWVKFAKKKGIYTLSSSFVYWRLSDVNISNTSAANGNLKVVALTQFAKWSLGFFNLDDKDELSRCFKQFIYDQINGYNIDLTFNFIYRISNELNSILNIPLIDCYKFFFRKLLNNLRLKYSYLKLSWRRVLNK